MAAARECICKVVQWIITAPHWLNADLSVELRIETRVSSHSIAALRLQQHLDKLQTWTHVASWSHYLESLEKL